MAFTPNQFLKPTSNVTLRDPQHAARLFTDDQFRLAPKQKFLFHVAFSINQAALLNIDLVQRHRNEINMLVKSCDLPNFAIQVETLNQYNRKKNTQYTHKYNPINMVFHDDNMGLVNQLWHNYYNYYYADPSSAKDAGAYNRNATQNFSYVNNLFGLDNFSTLPFFNHIKIYQMARHEYVSYTLHNPLITSWNHNKVAYSDSSTHDNQMQLAYEAVSYETGDVVSGDPEGFGIEHYDRTPSPLQPGNTTGIGNISPSFVNGTNIVDNSTQFISNLTKTINSYQNSKELPAPAPTGSLSTIISTVTQGVSGIQGVAFPVSNQNNNTILATQINVGR